jgi:type IV pilus assembly protein PilM
VNAPALLDRLRRRLLQPEPASAAIEVRASGVAAIRLAGAAPRASLGAAAAFELQPDVVQLSLTEPNLRDPGAFQRTLALLADRVGLARGARVALVLPDPVARVAFIPAAEIEARSRAELLEQLRFRLRKSVPFEIREAQLSWAELPGAPGRPAQLMICAIFGAVLAGYEAPLRELGLEPGFVELSGLALLGALRALPAADEMLVNWDAGYCTLALLREGEPMLLRTLAGRFAAEPEEVAREAANTVLYYRERVGGAGLARALLRSALLPPDEAVELLSGPLGLRPEPIDPWGALAGAPAAAQAMPFAGAAAALLGRAA